jgi:hypothetical protein
VVHRLILEVAVFLSHSAHTTNRSVHPDSPTEVGVVALSLNMPPSSYVKVCQINLGYLFTQVFDAHAPLSSLSYTVENGNLFIYGQSPEGISNRDGFELHNTIIDNNCSMAEYLTFVSCEDPERDKGENKIEDWVTDQRVVASNVWDDSEEGEEPTAKQGEDKIGAGNRASLID